MDGIRSLLGGSQTLANTKAVVNFDMFGGRFKPQVNGDGLSKLLASFSNQATAAKQSEAKTYVGSLNRGQQAFYLEHNKFAQDFTELGLGITEETENYSYSSALAGDRKQAVINAACPKVSGLKGYLGIVSFDDGDRLVATLCETSSSEVDINHMMKAKREQASTDIELLHSCPGGTNKV